MPLPLRRIVPGLLVLSLSCVGDDPPPADSATTGATAEATTGASDGTTSASTSTTTTGEGTETAASTTTAASTEPGTTAPGTGPDTSTTAPATSTGEETGTSSDATTDDTGTTGEPMPATPCTSVSQLTNPNGLTDAMRQKSGVVTGPLLPPGTFSLLEYVTLFGAAAGTYPPDEPDPTGYGFPGTDQNRLTFTLDRDKYVALQFRAPSAPAWDQQTGSLFLIPAGAFVSASIARCPGQFVDDPAWPMPPGCNAFGEATIPWRIGGPACFLEPGATYYVNVINAALESPTDSACDAANCKFKLMSKHATP